MLLLAHSISIGRFSLIARPITEIFLLSLLLSSQDASLPQFSTSQIHLDILNGNDDELRVEHIFRGTSRHLAIPPLRYTHVISDAD